MGTEKRGNPGSAAVPDVETATERCAACSREAALALAEGEVLLAGLADPATKLAAIRAERAELDALEAALVAQLAAAGESV